MSAAPAAAPVLAGKPTAAADVTGTLAVADREAARRALGALISRLGGQATSRRGDAGREIVEIVVPAAGYPELIAGLAEIGRWEASTAPSELPPQVRLSLILVD
jgi:hypothetical protein